MQSRPVLLWMLTFLALSCVTTTGCAEERGEAQQQSEWPAWQRFSERFIQADGRVIDLTFDGKSTSEGQSYALFFALVANRPQQFETLLNWTSANLADGELGGKLPGWLWGKRDDGSWGIKDRNAASDADLWMAYALLEAGRLWQVPRYTTLGKQLLVLVEKQEVVRAGKAGTLLLPGPMGFALEGERYRINPSYLPGFMLRYFANVDAKGPWQALWNDYLHLAPQVFASGVAPDLFIVDRRGVVGPDSERTPSGSYDAIRVYLWAGMSGGDESRELLRLLAPFSKVIQANAGVPPEKLQPATAQAIAADYAPIGYSGAVLPFLSALQERKLHEKQLDRLRRDLMRAKLGGDTNYYDQALILFGEGWQEGFYRFAADGRLQPRWLTR
jgi:endo-1,4-beta-D-glucanase Y